MRRLIRLLWVVFTGLALRACVVEPVRLTDDSMMPLLADGETILVSKLAYGLRIPGSGAILLEWKKPAKGDLVVAVSVGDPPLNLLRRIEAIPGDSVKLPDGKETVLLKDQYYLSADQKDRALDSGQFGIILRRAIIGKATHIWLPRSQIASSPGGSKVESRNRFFQEIL